ncbi:hypothetical protein JCM11491_005036 [Sporobolomyces phaffii]
MSRTTAGRNPFRNLFRNVDDAWHNERASRGITGSVDDDCEHYDSLDNGRRSGLTSKEFWQRRDWLRWNKAEELEFAMLRGPPMVSPRDFNQHLIYLDEPAYAAIMLKTEEVARAHAELGIQMLASNALVEFEDKWRAMTNAQRTRRVIDGLRHATLITGDYQACVRLSTPDLTVASMAKDPNGVITLLRHIIRSYLAHPNQDGYDEWIDPTGLVDRFYGIQRTEKGQVPLHRAIRNMQAAINGDRQTYIVRFVSGILLALGYVRAFKFRIPSIDLPRLPVYGRNIVRGVNPAGPRIHDDNLDMLNIDGKQTQAEVDRERAVADMLDAGKEDHCAACYRVRDEIKEMVESGGKMLVCSKCIKVNRRITYCSTSCQGLDWPRHKREVFCGKVLSKVLSPPLFSPASQDPLPTLAYYAQFEHTRPRSSPDEVTYRLIYRVDSSSLSSSVPKGDVKRRAVEVVPSATEQAEIAEILRQLRGRGASNLDQVRRVFEILRPQLDDPGDDAFDEAELAQNRVIEQTLVRQLAREFDVDPGDFAAKCDVKLVPLGPAPGEEQGPAVGKENVIDSASPLVAQKTKKKSKSKNKNKNKKKKKTKGPFSDAADLRRQLEESPIPGIPLSFLEQFCGMSASDFDDSDGDEEGCTCGLSHGDDDDDHHHVDMAKMNNAMREALATVFPQATVL